MSTNRRQAKRDAILDAARSLFLANGYLGTSMDAVAETSAVSKQTVYNHFGDKKTLFEELLTRDMASADVDIDETAMRVGSSGNLERDLVEFARVYLRSILQPHLVRMRRLVIGEAERFPQLAAVWYKNGPEQAYEMLSQLFARLGRRGLLKNVPRLAAEQFNWLILSVPLNRAMAFVDEEMPPTEDEIENIAASAASMFLATCGINKSADSPKSST